MRRWLPVIVLALAQFVMVLDSTVMNVSISDVVADLDTTVSNMQLAIACYTLVMAAFMLTGAALGDRWGRRRAFTIGLLVYGVGSGITAVAPTFNVLFFGWSIVEGLGAVLVVPAIMALVAANYEGRDRALAFGIVGGIAGAGAAVGPIIGGWVTTTYTWRLVFAAEVVIVLGVLASTKVIADGPRKPVTGRLDTVGTLLSAVGFGAIVVALVESSSWGWVRPLDPPFTVVGFSPTIPIIVAGVGVLLGLVSWSEHLRDHGGTPLLDPALLRVTQLRSSLSTLGVQQFAIAGSLFALPLYLQVVLGLDALDSGIRLLPLSVALFVLSLGGAALANRLGPRILVQAGLLATVVGTLILISAIEPELQGVPFGCAMAVIGAGIGLMASQLGNVAQSAVDATRSSEVGGLQGTAQNLGASLGTALVGAVLLTGLAAGFANRVEANDDVSKAASEQVQAAADRGLDFVPVDAVAQAARDAGVDDAEAAEVTSDYADAQLQALRAALFVVVVVGLGGIWVARRLPKDPLTRATPEPATNEPVS